MRYIDNFLNKITMYRLVLYYLLALVVVTLVFGLFGILPYSPINLLFSTVVILAVCWVVNTVCAASFDAATNIESVYITALILTLIITPIAPTDSTGLGFLVFASAWAMASKYLFAVDKKHIFNPAAFAVALSSLAFVGSATWWVGGNIPLLPFVFIGGLLIVRKTRRFDLVASFSLVALATIAITSNTNNALTPVAQAILRTPFFFFAFVMLTEPITMPPTRRLRIVYAAMVGLLFAPNIHIGGFYFSPEMALLVGNIFAFLVSPEGRLTLKLVEKNKLAEDVYEFVFTPDRPLAFRPGQYLEWTLLHPATDTRGNRRYFTIASSPTESTLRLGVKFYPKSSSYKQALHDLEINDTVTAAQLAGDFVMPSDPSKKLAFIAGGIGVTPFRSQVQYLMDKHELRSVVLLYANNAGTEVAYRDIFDRAASVIGLKTAYVTMVDSACIAKEVPDYNDRVFYISGPPGMVDACKKTLRQMGVSRFNIKTDYFPGLA